MFHGKLKSNFSEKIFKTQRLSKNGVTGVTGVTKNTNALVIVSVSFLVVTLLPKMVTPVTPLVALF